MACATPLPSALASCSGEGTSPSRYFSSSSSSVETMPSTRLSRTDSSWAARSSGIGTSVGGGALVRVGLGGRAGRRPLGTTPPRRSAAAGARRPSRSAPAAWARAASKFARSRSILLTKRARGMLLRLGHLPDDLGLHLDAVDRGDHEDGEVGDGAAAAATSPMKSGKPGVSSRLILWFRHGNCARARLIERPFSRSSGSWSSTPPMRLMAPAFSRIASPSVVLPEPPWPDEHHVADLRRWKHVQGAEPPSGSVRPISGSPLEDTRPMTSK